MRCLRVSCCTRIFKLSAFLKCLLKSSTAACAPLLKHFKPWPMRAGGIWECSRHQHQQQLSNDHCSQNTVAYPLATPSNPLLIIIFIIQLPFDGGRRTHVYILLFPMSCLPHPLNRACAKGTTEKALGWTPLPRIMENLGIPRGIEHSYGKWPINRWFAYPQKYTCIVYSMWTLRISKYVQFPIILSHHFSLVAS